MSACIEGLLICPIFEVVCRGALPEMAECGSYGDGVVVAIQAVNECLY